ncbi:LTA synthase family protein [Stenotrophomonas sp. AB1(2024)]|uniref:LTA synthase family protein n=1 Tax=Stenotrophomonas sp. AB1(2024) TaxID=3132215 RepID=UPI00309C3DBB
MALQNLQSPIPPRYRPIDLLQIAVTAASCISASLIAQHAFFLDYRAGAIFVTALLVAPIFVLLAPSFRNVVWACVTNAALCHLLLIGHAVKVAAMKAPIQATDFEAVPLLISTLSGRYLVVGGVLLVALSVLLLFCFKPRRRSVLPLGLGLGYSVLLVLSSGAWVEPIGRLVDNADADKRTTKNYDETTRNGAQLERLKAEGGLLYLLKDWQDMRRDIGYIPDFDEVASTSPERWSADTGPKPSRNVHIVLLESIWDTSVLDGLEGTEDALDPRFRALWERAGKPHGLSPVIGGATANAEFEVLCALPAPSNSIAFLETLKNTTPCLPGLFQKLGYRTMASHPHRASNWGRNEAYARVGFEEFNAVDAFNLDDLDGPFLADGSMFNQNLPMLAAQSARPTFNYIVSLSSHWGYTRDTKRRPDKVAFTGDGLKLLPNYLNASAYTTAAVMDWTEHVLAADPDALIVIFGDHAPVLDSQPDVYKRLNGKVSGQFDGPMTRHQIGMARVPLLIIDGEEGPVHLPNDVPLFQLAGVIGKQLHRPRLLPQVRGTSRIVVRPVLGQLLANIDDKWFNCGTQGAPRAHPGCDEAWAEHTKNRLIRQDLVAGSGYYLRLAGSESLTRDMAPLNIVSNYKSCEFSVKSWGPSTAQVGQAFNATPEGRSSIWITFNSLRGSPEVQIGSTWAPTVVGDNLMTADLPTELLTAVAGELPVHLRCPAEKSVKIGALKIH